jgi:hypothetical protein
MRIQDADANKLNKVLDSLKNMQLGVKCWERQKMSFEGKCFSLSHPAIEAHWLLTGCIFRAAQKMKQTI